MDTTNSSYLKKDVAFTISGKLGLLCHRLLAAPGGHWIGTFLKTLLSTASEQHPDPLSWLGLGPSVDLAWLSYSEIHMSIEMPGVDFTLLNAHRLGCPMLWPTAASATMTCESQLRPHHLQYPGKQAEQ